MDPRAARFPNPVPVGGQPALPVPPNALGNQASSPSLTLPYGEQKQWQWAPGDKTVKPLLSLQLPPFGMVWRITIFGPIVFSVSYGTSGNRVLGGFQAPSVFTVAGKINIDGGPPGNGGGVATVTVSQASGGARSALRRFITAPAGDVNMQPEAIDYVALVDSSLTTSGELVAVPALSVCPLVAGSVLHSGSGFQEFEL